MGAELSVPLSRMPDNNTIFQKTSNTIEAMNRILDFLLMNSDVRDMISLGDTEKCKNWLILGENKLSEVFDKVKIKPQVTKDGATNSGILFIKKIKVLEKLQDDQAARGCKLLAFFFIRLFQIVGALSLSIIDTKIPEDDYNPAAKIKYQTDKGRIPLLREVKDKQRSFLGMFKGGAASLPDNLKFLDKHIMQDTIDENILVLKYPIIDRQVIKYTSNPVGYNITPTNNSINIQYTSGTNNSISFTITTKEGGGRLLIITDVKRNGEEIRLRTNEYTFGVGDQNIISVKYLDEETNRTEDINFTKFLSETYLMKEIENKPLSVIGQILKKYKYYDKSSVDENYYKLNNINISSNSVIIVEKSDLLNSLEPSFIFKGVTESDNKKITAEFSFKLKVLNETRTVITIKIDELKNNTEQYKDIPIAIEQSENEEKAESENTKSNDPDTRNFTIKSTFGSIKQPTYGNQTIPKFLEVRFKDIFNKFLKEVGEGYKKSKRGFLNPPLEGDEDELKFKQLWMTLAAESPVKAFCTARALQLLNKSGLYSSLTPDSLQFIQSTKLPDTIVSHISSDSKFPLVQNKSLPSPGQPITTAEGFAALNKLYITPKDNFVDPSTTPSDFFGLFAQSTGTDDRTKKQDSLEKLIKSFRTEENKLGNTIKTLNDITDINPKLPKSSFEPKKDMAKLRALRLQAIKLFQIQFNHTRRVNELLNKLFKIDNKIELRPEILSKGVNGIEEIAQEARDVLTDYYAGCQTEYVKGVNILTGKTKVVANPATNTNNA